MLCVCIVVNTCNFTTDWHEEIIKDALNLSYVVLKVWFIHVNLLIVVVHIKEQVHNNNLRIQLFIVKYLLEYSFQNCTIKMFSGK